MANTPRNDLKEARIAAGLTQTELAAKIDKTQTVVSRYESGEYAIDVDTAPVLARALSMDVLDVLYPKKKAA
jgi:ribosome-binding protein aMBF1 (putative translation factor)